MKVWIDCDPGIDDMLALLYAIKSPEIEILGISTVSGNVDAEKGLKNVLKLQNVVDFNIPIYKGETSDCWIGAEDTHGLNGIGNHYMPVVYDGSDYRYSNSSAAMFNAVCANPGDVTLVCLGPLTNLCKTVEEYPMFIDMVKEVGIMGGCYKYPGNCSPVTEYNFWADPISANKVFEAFQYCNKLRVIGLEITHKFILTSERLNYWKQLGADDIYKFVEGITDYYFKFHKMQEGISGCVINDPVVIYALKNLEFLYAEDYYVQVLGEVENRDIRGMMLCDVKSFYKHIPNAKVATHIKPSKEVEDFWEDFTKTVFEK